MKDVIILFLGVMLGTLLYEIFNDIYLVIKIKSVSRNRKKLRGEG